MGELIEFDGIPTQDDAIALAIGASQPGEIVEVHDPECKISEDPNTGETLTDCTCEPMILVVGATA